MPLSLAAALLGVSHTTVRRWTLSGDIPTVEDASGRNGVPVQALLGLHERVVRERGNGGGREHVIERVMAGPRRRASELDVLSLIDAGVVTDAHERARLRSLAYQLAVARELDRATIDDARHRIWQWRDDGRIDDRHGQAWEDVLARSVPEVCEVLSQDSSWAADLRQSSPFAGVLSEAERREILRAIS